MAGIYGLKRSEIWGFRWWVWAKPKKIISDNLIIILKFNFFPLKFSHKA